MATTSYLDDVWLLFVVIVEGQKPELAMNGIAKKV